MDEKLQKIIELLQQNIFLKKEKKAEILRKLKTEKISDAQTDAFLLLLENAAKKQKVVIEKIVEKNPNFVANLKKFISQKFLAQKKIEEKIAREKEAENFDVDALLDEI